MVVCPSVETLLAPEPHTAVQLALDWWGSALASANSTANGAERSLPVKVRLATSICDIHQGCIQDFGSGGISLSQCANNSSWSFPENGNYGPFQI